MFWWWPGFQGAAQNSSPVLTERGLPATDILPFVSGAIKVGAPALSQEDFKRRKRVGLRLIMLSM